MEDNFEGQGKGEWGSRERGQRGIETIRNRGHLGSGKGGMGQQETGAAENGGFYNGFKKEEQ